ncbi:Uncharacterised protein [Legionella donaldsonii]|uniref:Uncharacterized protein n=1 Tax=Legionella donaldsonii TaxID=45060 RepID=A0A378IYY1_9GAMM|nr:Uncharacterised protein [Legionella donaldsonii]
MEHVLKAKDVEMHPAVPHVDLFKNIFFKLQDSNTDTT